MSSDSHPVAAHDIVAYGGGLFGVSVLLYQAWSGASLEHILSSAATSGLVAYLTLAVGFAAARSIIRSPPNSPSSNEESTSSPDDSEPDDSDTDPEANGASEIDTEPEEADEQTAAEPQAA